MPLTDKLIKAHMRDWTGPKPEMVKDSKNLFLSISGPDTASWVYRYKVRRRGRRHGLGSYPMVSITHAREKRNQCDGLRARGIDPIDHHREATRRGATFEEAARAYWLAHCQDMAKPSNWIAMMEKHVFPHIGHRELFTIQTHEVEKFMRLVWGRHVGKKVRSAVNNVFKNQAATDERIDASLMEKVASVIGTQRLPENNLPAIHYSQIPDFWATIPDDTSLGLSLRLATLTSLRDDAILGAQWDEIVFKEGTWKIPVERCKGWDTGFHVPITDDMKRIFERAGKLFGKTGPVFPSDTTKSGLIHQNAHRNWIQNGGWRDPDGRPATAHGLRATFRTWATDVLRGDPLLYEHMLMHVEAKGSEVQRAYARVGRFHERREVMEQYAEYVTSVEREAAAEARRAEVLRDRLDTVVEASGRTLREVEEWARAEPEDAAIEAEEERAGKEARLQEERAIRDSH